MLQRVRRSEQDLSSAKVPMLGTFHSLYTTVHEIPLFVYDDYHYTLLKSYKFCEGRIKGLSDRQHLIFSCSTIHYCVAC